MGNNGMSLHKSLASLISAVVYDHILQNDIAGIFKKDDRDKQASGNSNI